MVQIDWGNLEPTRGQRERAQARIQHLTMLDGPVVALRKYGHGYEAQIRTVSASAPAELRLQGGDLASLLDRAVELLTIVARERTR